ncbi:polyketide synthase [Trichoderma novae-zelandiae]
MATSSIRTLLMFGPGAMSLNETYFASILSFISSDSASQWALTAVRDIEAHWPSLCEAIPKLQHTPGVGHAQKLAEWLRTGTLTPGSTIANLPNAILGPLVVIAQLVEYLRHVDSLSESGLRGGEGFEVPSASNAETVGCCLGTFSALVVSSSSSWAQFCHNASAVVRIVFVLGALSDAQDASGESGPSVSLIAFWRGGQSLSDLKTALEKFPEAYISVLYDENRVTVTTSTRTVAALKNHLQTVGITANETEFHGRFHAAQLYKAELEAFLLYCRRFPTFQLPDASCVVVPTRVNSEDVVAGQESLLEISCRAFLVSQFDWIKTFRSAVSSTLQDRASRIIEFGPERCVPPTLLRRLNSQVTHFDFEESIKRAKAHLGQGQGLPAGVAENDIAVIGMACKVAGADDVDEYWKLLLQGKSQHRELLPNDRFVMETPFRPVEAGDDKKKWFGNFIGDHDAFDHKFFKKSPREALHMDPQQRLMLQAAYQAVSQSGYYNVNMNVHGPTKVGCYIGVVANDYENNISHTTPIAFSATGALRSYIAGKVSHFFGWTGPAMTVDTACSASTVALDLACKAILSGECSAALVGGTNFYSTPMFFQNLAAGSFLSTTGQCKPFDAKADGYCRGEAVGTVFLKKLSQAIADGDQVLGVIAATAINQNRNETPIFVPNSPSLTNVFRTAIQKSGLDAKDISVVEAHGTGTPVGDPVEYDSIRQVFGGSARAGQDALQIGSVKGLIGHTEGASGVVALVKILLMLQRGQIPPQASFDSINPSIKYSASDHVEITKTPLPWKQEFKAALINNYGAAGSNASVIIKQRPAQLLERLPPVVDRETEALLSKDDAGDSPKYPFFLSGLDEKAILAYAHKLRQFVDSRGDLDIQDLAFSINRQSNWSLGRGSVFSSSSVAELDEKLASIETFPVRSSQPPVILCFGGQVSTSVGLNYQLFAKSTVLRRHLDQCDAICKSIGAGSIYPRIFQSEPIDDPSVLQPLLFSMQYSSAMSWIDCGIVPAKLVGHSFGELTALCISGVLSLQDGLKLVYGRSKIIKGSWGAEKGSMLAVEADLEELESLLATVNASLQEGRATIACFNGPRSFTVAGSVAAIDAVQQAISNTQLPLKHKRLNVTNAFHSVLVERLKPDLEALGRQLTFAQPQIPLERATRSREDNELSAVYVADHMREPVYFHQAVERIAKEYPEALWLEAGSNSTITTMASKALGLPKASNFQPVNVTNNSKALSQLADVTMNLRKAGLHVSFWPHSRAQTYEYKHIILPPYQFEKHRQWLEFKPPQAQQVVVETVSSTEAGNGALQQQPVGLYMLLDRGKDKYRFRINTAATQFVDAMAGHAVANTQTCPATFEMDLAVQALGSVHPELADTSSLDPQIYNIVNREYIHDPSRELFVLFERLGHDDNSWLFQITSKGTDGGETLHMSGQLHFQASDDARSRLEFSRLGRFITHDRCLQVLESSGRSDEVIQGQTIYSVLSSSDVHYGQRLRGLQRLVGRSNESAGRIVRRRSGKSFVDFALGEVFTQVGSIWANCMAQHLRDTKNKIVYVATGIEQWSKSSDVLQKFNQGFYDNDPEVEWHVLAQHKRDASDDSFTTDIFVFDAASGDLEEVILGIRYAPVSLDQLLSGSTTTAAAVPIASRYAPLASPFVPVPTTTKQTSVPQPQEAVKKPAPVAARKRDIKTELWLRLRPVLADISGLEPEEIQQTDALADIGIDSLMGMEMAREVETTFNCTVEQSELLSIVDVPGILKFLQSTLGDEDVHDSSESMSSASSDGNVHSPPTSGSEMASPNLKASYGLSYSASDLSTPAVLEAFSESSAETDRFLKAHGCAGYLDGVSQKQTRLCLVLTSAAFKQLGCDLEAAKPGEVLQPVPFVERHRRFHQYLYGMLEETRIINIDGDVMTRTAIPLPSQSADAILQDLMRRHADNGASHQLAYNVGSKMADVLSGKADGPQLIFGDAKNRELVANFYGELPFNKLYFELMADFFTRLAAKLKLSSSQNGTPTLKILEMGAGTGGTTKVLVPVLAKLGIPLEYTFTDLSPSLVAQAKRRFKEYPFMKFAVHDIEQPPSDPELVGSQHVVIASNAVHATHSLRDSAQHIRKFLRPDGFLMLLEMMRTLHWVDVVWGTLEGWWLFDDGRTHAIVNERRWEKELLASGFKHVRWTDGKLPEVHVQRVIIALAGGADGDLSDIPALASPGREEEEEDHHGSVLDGEERKRVANAYVQNTIRDFSIPSYTGPILNTAPGAGASVLVTGATGSLGSHLVAHIAGLPSVDTIFCLNRPRPGKKGQEDQSRDPLSRQMEVLASKGIELSEAEMGKLRVVETDLPLPRFGLDESRYEQLLNSVTHVVHSAFPVNGLRSLKQNEPQFTLMRNLVDLAASVSARRPAEFKFTFQFISSLSAVGMFPKVHGEKRVPEQQWDVDSALPNGYGEAKVICERVLLETLGQHPDRFRAMTVRLGQLSGSMKTGYWNHMEMLSFLFKSAQTLRALPDVDGELSWLHLEDASASLADLLLRDAPTCHAVYHLDNPLPRDWREVMPVLADALDVPRSHIVPFHEWLRRVRAYPGEDPWDNPSAKAMDFFEHKFKHMSCGGVMMATDHSLEHSATLRAVRPVSDELVHKYIQAWKESGFLR